MGRLGDQFNNFGKGKFGGNSDHLRARNHDVPYLHIRYLQCAFDNAEGVSVKNLILFGIPDQLQQTLRVSGLIGKYTGYFIDPGLGSWIDARLVVSHDRALCGPPVVSFRYPTK